VPSSPNSRRSTRPTTSGNRSRATSPTSTRYAGRSARSRRSASQPSTSCWPSQDPQTELAPELRSVLTAALWTVRGVAAAARRQLPAVGQLGTSETAAIELVMALDHVAIARLLRFGSREDLATLRQVGGEP
jgi:hypothetical protein